MENNTRKKKTLTTALAVAVAALLLIGGGTFAYLQDQTDDTINVFNTNQVSVDLEESTGNEYNIIPGTEQIKDPKVTVDNTVDAYVFVEVTDKTQGLVTYEIADGWMPLDGYKDVYYREVGADETVKGFYVLNDNKVYYSPALENSDMLDENGNLKEGIELTFKAYAIQKAPFNDPAQAYPYINASVVTSEAELKEALESGESVVLSNDVEIPSTNGNYTEYNLADNTVLDLGGNTMTVPYLKGIFQGKDISIRNGRIESAADYPLFVGNGTKDTNAVIENVDLNGGINVFDGQATLRNVNADASPKKYYAVWADNGAVITIESGTYIGGMLNGNQMPAVNSSNPTNPEEDGPAGIVIIKGGKFNTDVSKYVAEGYKVIEENDNGNTWYVVVSDDN